MVEKKEEKTYTPEQIKKLYIRGCFTNFIPLTIMYFYATGLNLEIYVAIACGIQYSVFFFHGLPNSSEKFYDLSGSITHFAVVATSLIVNESTRTPRQMMIALASVVWMVRLGSFLYLRICKDGRDERFDALK